MPLTAFLVKKEFSLYRPVLIFQPTVNLRASEASVSNSITH